MPLLLALSLGIATNSLSIYRSRVATMPQFDAIDLDQFTDCITTYVPGTYDEPTVLRTSTPYGSLEAIDIDILLPKCRQN